MWQIAAYRLSNGLNVPPASGIYAVYGRSWVYGLPSHEGPIYIGISCDLRRRFREHLGPDEPNERLRELVEQAHETTFYFQVMPIADAGALERELIRCLQPLANRAHRGREIITC
jgi:excinuclease UvrABC nuclease subunit